MKTLIRAAENKQRGRMRPSGRQFDMPAFRYVPKNVANVKIMLDIADVDQKTMWQL